MTGLGLIGLLTVQLLRAQGCRVLGLDFDAARLALARQFGVDVVDLSAGQDPVAAAAQFSRGRGVDAVIITASTKSSEPVHQAALMCRKRGRIVLVGVTGLELANYSSFCASACLRGLFLKRPDVVIATSPQLLVGLTGWWIGRLKRCPFVFEVRDLWPESLLASGVGRQDSLLIRSLERLTSFLYHRSDRIAVVTEAFKENLTTRRRLPTEKIDVVENGVETELFSPEKVAPLYEHLTDWTEGSSFPISGRSDPRTGLTSSSPRLGSGGGRAAVAWGK